MEEQTQPVFQVPPGTPVQSPQVEAVVNPLMRRIQMPGETFTLPSGGIFYTHGELDDSVQNAEVRVHPMTAIDEITIKTPDMLFSGDAIRQVFSRCIPQVKKVDGLFAKDVDFLLVCLRKVSYGNELVIEHTHNCKDAKEHSYSIDVSEFVKKARRIDPTSITSEFKVDMPNSQVVMLQPVTYESFVKVMQTTDSENLTDVKKIRDMMVDSVLDIVTQVDEVVDKKQIREWLLGIPPSFLKAINTKLEKTLKWGPDFSTKIKCLDCGKDVEIVAPMNPLSFFT